MRLLGVLWMPGYSMGLILDARVVQPNTLLFTNEVAIWWHVSFFFFKLYTSLEVLYWRLPLHDSLAFHKQLVQVLHDDDQYRVKHRDLENPVDVDYQTKCQLNKLEPAGLCKKQS